MDQETALIKHLREIYRIGCALCTTEADTEVDSKFQAAAEFAADGWIVRETGDCICPDCAAMEEDR